VNKKELTKRHSNVLERLLKVNNGTHCLAKEKKESCPWYPYSLNNSLIHVTTEERLQRKVKVLTPLFWKQWMAGKERVEGVERVSRVWDKACEFSGRLCTSVAT
jgi:hypothetical protein